MGCFSVLFLARSPCLHGRIAQTFVGRLERGESGITVEALAALEIGKEVDALLEGWREVGEGTATRRFGVS